MSATVEFTTMVTRGDDGHVTFKHRCATCGRWMAGYTLGYHAASHMPTLRPEDPKPHDKEGTPA